MKHDLPCASYPRHFATDHPTAATPTIPGGIISDLVALKFGMRGRLWALWIAQTLGGVFCLVLAYVDHSLSSTIIIIVVFSIFCQQSCGFSYGIVPFISRRGYGVASGFIGAGGNVGGAVTQVRAWRACSE